MSGDRATPRLEVRGLVIRYDGCAEIDRLDLTIAEAGINALVGPSGCGKTSLLRAIAGFEVPSAGSVAIDGRKVSGPDLWIQPERREVGLVFQQGALFPHLTVEKNVAYGLRRDPDARARVEATLAQVGLERFAGRYPDQLSGGQQQLVALARALAPSPRMILLDEPFASLDAGLRSTMRERVIRILRAAGTTAILVSHDQDEALSVADSLAVMVGGRIAQQGPPEEIYLRPATVDVAEFIGGGQLLPCTILPGFARSALGELPTTSGCSGKGQLLVRSEDLVLEPENSGEPGPIGEVICRSFHGHDLIHEVRLGSGELVRVRMLAHGDHAVGSRVRVAPRPRQFHVIPD